MLWKRGSLQALKVTALNYVTLTRSQVDDQPWCLLLNYEQNEDFY